MFNTSAYVVFIVLVHLSNTSIDTQWLSEVQCSLLYSPMGQYPILLHGEHCLKNHKGSSARPTFMDKVTSTIDSINKDNSNDMENSSDASVYPWILKSRYRMPSSRSSGALQPPSALPQLPSFRTSSTLKPSLWTIYLLHIVLHFQQFRQLQKYPNGIT